MKFYFPYQRGFKLDIEEEETFDTPKARKKRTAKFSPNTSTEERFSKLQKPGNMSPKNKSSDYSNEAIMKKLDGLDSINVKIDQIESKIDDVKTLFNNLREKTNQIDNRLSSLEPTSNNAFSSFTQNFHTMSAEINRLDQVSMQNDFIMYGLPPGIKTADLQGIFDSIGAILVVNLKVPSHLQLTAK